MKHSFKSDYCELAHPSVLAALSAVGNAQFEGYGLDEYTQSAAELIRLKAAAPDAEVHFISGGTQLNLVLISAALRPHEAVISPESGHISVHETGAIEATGHKICTAKSKDGKLRAADIEAIIEAHSDEHMVSPKLVYISQSTETGQVYTKAELSAIADTCRRNALYLFVDGARIGAAVNSPDCDLDYADIAEAADAFYIGGTKNGALFGEALVICNKTLKTDFRSILKQRGALLSKGAAIGIQFEALMKDGLFETNASHANAMALKMANGITEAGYELLFPAQTNIIIPLFPNDAIQTLRQQYDFYDFEKTRTITSVRLVTSWATPESKVDEFLKDLRNINCC